MAKKSGLHLFPGGSAGKESSCNVGDIWVRSLGREDPLERLPTPVFWPGEFHGLYSPWGCGADTTKQLSTTTSFIATWWSKGILWEPVYSVPKVMTEF